VFVHFELFVDFADDSLVRLHVFPNVNLAKGPLGDFVSDLKLIQQNHFPLLFLVDFRFVEKRDSVLLTSSSSTTVAAASPLDRRVYLALAGVLLGLLRRFGPSEREPWSLSIVCC